MFTSEEERPLLKNLNEHIICSICTGYLIDATTLVECLHSFCRGCIVRRLSSGVRVCPVCNVAVQSPLLPDIKLQRLVYLTVPGLFRSELEKRRHFRLINPQCSNLTPLVGAPDLTFDDLVSLSLCEIDNSYINGNSEGSDAQKHNDRVLENLDSNTDYNKSDENKDAKNKVRYLKCPAGVTVRHILRLLMLKRGWDDSDHIPVTHKIEILAETSDENNSLQLLNPSWTLLDLSFIFKWKRDAPMKLLYRIIGKDDNTSIRKSDSIYRILDSDNTNPIIEDSQRPLTPPPSPKPNTCIKMPCSIKSNQSHSRTKSKESEAKKPRCEVTPLIRSVDTKSKKSDIVKETKISKVEHHRRKRHRNKRVIAEITTKPREDILKLKVRLTSCSSRTQNVNQTKEKTKNSTSSDKHEKLNPNPPQEQTTSTKRTKSPAIEDESDEETIEQIIDSIPDEVVQMAQDINNASDSESLFAKEKTNKTETEAEDKPKDAEVLRQLGLVNTHEIDREKLEKQFQESKANRVRSLLAEKQMRDTLESIKMAINKVNDSTSGASTTKKKGPPPLTPLKTMKLNKLESTAGSFVQNKEAPLDLSNGGMKDALDLSSSPSLSKQSSSTPTSVATSKVGSKTVEKPKEDRPKSQDTNLRTLSDAAVSLLGGSSTENKTEETSSVAKKVALKIPQPHQRLPSFGMKMKPNLGIRHIPNPQAIVASQFRNQRSGYLTSNRQQ